MGYGNALGLLLRLLNQTEPRFHLTIIMK